MNDYIATLKTENEQLKKEHDQLEAKNHEMREVIIKTVEVIGRNCTPVVHHYLGEHLNHLRSFISKSSDCGKGLIKAGELDKTIEFVSKIIRLSLPKTWHEAEGKAELSRLHQLIERAKK